MGYDNNYDYMVNIQDSVFLETCKNLDKACVEASKKQYGCITTIRICGEKIAKFAYRKLTMQSLENKSFAQLLKDSSFRNALKKKYDESGKRHILLLFYAIKNEGNKAAHDYYVDPKVAESNFEKLNKLIDIFIKPLSEDANIAVYDTGEKEDKKKQKQAKKAQCGIEKLRNAQQAAIRAKKQQNAREIAYKSKERNQIIDTLVSQYQLPKDEAKLKVNQWVDNIECDVINELRTIQTQIEGGKNKNYKLLQLGEPKDLVIAKKLFPELTIWQDTILNQITFGWTRHPKAKKYEVWQKSFGNEYKRVHEGSFPITQYTTDSLIPGMPYAFIVRCLLVDGNWSGFSPPIGIIVGSIDAPFNIRGLSRKNSNVQIEWDYPSRADEYHIRKIGAMPGNNQDIASIPGNGHAFTLDASNSKEVCSYYVECRIGEKILNSDAVMAFIP